MQDYCIFNKIANKYAKYPYSCTEKLMKNKKDGKRRRIHEVSFLLDKFVYF